jgi:SAM-dependent methyltransferase
MRGPRLPRRSRGLTAAGTAPSPPPPVPCQICGSPTTPGLDLGHQPISDRLLSDADLNAPETFYPMRLQHCGTCGLTQLSYIAPPEEVYRDFPFVSGTTRTARRHLQTMPARLVKLAGLTRRSFAVDIGSNDGTLLEGYARYGVRILGVDPSALPVRVATERGIPTLHAFFNVDTAKYIRKVHGPAHAISAAGVFGHIADLDGVMCGIVHLLAPKGVFASDNQYWLDMVQRLHYDNMFHQHLRYYALRPMIELHRRYGLEIIDVERSDVYGGSFRVFTARAGVYRPSRRVTRLLELEEREDLYASQTTTRFAARVEERRRTLMHAIYEARAAGKRVIGLGAPAKAATVCNYCRLGPEAIDYITEVNPLRIGRFLPGMHIPIVREDRMFEESPHAEVGVLFAWNYYDEIVPKLRARGFTGEVICP